MKKLFHFDAPREKYTCDAVIIWCFDNRFELGFRKFLKRIGIEYSDPIKIAGGAKSLASPEMESERAFVLDQIQKSIRLHGTRRAVLMVHSDCGAYGGLEAFGDSPEAERRHHREELVKATEALQTAIPALSIEGYYVDFEGVWEVDTSKGTQTLTEGAV
jgi:hypothetical protein